MKLFSRNKNKADKHMKPLSKKARLIIWGAMLVVFFTVGPMILAYSVGIRLSDLSETFSWVQTGGIYVHSDVSNVEVFVDGKYMKSGGLIIRNTLVQNLKADMAHLVEVHKDDYHSWIKKLPVKESMVTEGRVLMLPKEIDAFAVYPFLDENNLGVATSSIETIENPEYLELEILFGLASSTDDETLADRLADRIDVFGDDLSTTTASSTLNIPEYFIELGIEDPESLENLLVFNNEVAWLEEGDIVMYWIGKEGEEPFYYCDFEECRDDFELDWDDDIFSFDFLPGREDVWVVLNKDGVWAVEVDDRSVRNVQPIYMGQDLDFRINSNNRVTVLNDGIFYELRF
jgi:hypothetical protein